MEAIRYSAFNDNSLLFLIFKTGSGKSVVPLTVASLCQGVAIILVSLVGLGSDQVNKALRPDHNIEAYDVDEFKRADGTKLRSRMKNVSDDEILVSTQILYMSRHALSKDSPWWPTLCDLEKRNLISVLCVDEAREIEQSGRSFLPEFGFAMENIKHLHDIMDRKCPRILMSATFRRIDQRTCVRYLGQEPGKVIWTEMSWRRIFFDVQISGNPSASIKSSLKVDFQNNRIGPSNNDADEPIRPMKVIIYTNSKKKAEESLTPSAEKGTG